MTDQKAQHGSIAEDAVAAAPEPSVDAERRAAIAKLGLLAAYTAPALLATMTAAQAQAPTSNPVPV